MGFNGLTKKGQEYLAKKMALGEPVEFSKVEIGNGSTAIPDEMESLNLFKKRATIIEKSQEENNFLFKIGIDNSDINTGFYVTEIGVFVNDDGTDILYHYIYQEVGSYIPNSNSPISYKWTLNTQVTNTEGVVLNWNGGNLFVTQESLEEKIVDLRTDINTSLALKLDKGNLPQNIQSAESILEVLQAKSGRRLDPDCLYIQEQKIKKQGFYYLDENQDGLWHCHTTTTEDINYNSASYFENESNAEISDKLENLVEFYGENNFKIKCITRSLNGNLPARTIIDIDIPEGTLHVVGSIGNYFRTELLNPYNTWDFQNEGNRCRVVKLTNTQQTVFLQIICFYK